MADFARAGVRWAIGSALLCLLAGCQNPSAPTVQLDEQFVLAPNTRVVVGDGPRVEFLGVSGDSRCPINAICIQGGDATVHLRLTDERETVEMELHTGDASRSTATFHQFLVVLLDVQPYPFAGLPTNPANYRAKLRVTRN